MPYALSYFCTGGTELNVEVAMRSVDKKQNRNVEFGMRIYKAIGIGPDGTKCGAERQHYSLIKI
jgi:hypothetical protein